MSDFELHPQLQKDCFVIADLELCRLLLMNDKNYPWCILVPRRESLREIYELNTAEQQQLSKESAQLAQAMMLLFRGKKMNIAALGNMVPQLHIHHIVRLENDACWPKPVWGQVSPVPYSDFEVQNIINKLQKALGVHESVR